MKRILVIGSCGAGKSTFAVRLGAVLKLPVIHLDTLYWKPNWVATPRDEWRMTVATLLERPEWIIDGDYGSTLPVRLAACDTVIFLNLSHWLCLWRVLKRRVLHHRTPRPDMQTGCPEQIDLDWLKSIWTYPAKEAPRILALLEEARATRQVIVLHTPAEMETFLHAVP